MGLDYDKAYSMETTWVALVNGVVAAAIQIFPFQIRWGSVELKVGGIGNVATLPEYRSRGLAQQILHRQSSFMKTSMT
jgi:predicted acetyltransferase